MVTKLEMTWALIAGAHLNKLLCICFTPWYYYLVIQRQIKASPVCLKQTNYVESRKHSCDALIGENKLPCNLFCRPEFLNQ